MEMKNNNDDLLQIEEPIHLQCQHEKASISLVTFWYGPLIQMSSSFCLDFVAGRIESVLSWTKDLATTDGTLVSLN